MKISDFNYYVVWFIIIMGLCLYLIGSDQLTPGMLHLDKFQQKQPEIIMKKDSVLPSGDTATITITTKK